MATHTNKIALVILAAGKSGRMGQPKQLLPWKGTTLLGNCIKEAQKSDIKDIYVVLGSNYKLIYNAHKSYAVNFIQHHNWKNDLGSSIAFGVKHIINKGYNGVLLLLADQPQINADYINCLLSLYQQHPTIVATSYVNSIGIPVIFNETFFEALQLNTNKKGAKSILKMHQESIKLLSIHKDNIEDIDTYSDYLNLYKKYHSSR